MRIDVFPQDRGGCGHYRLAWPAMALAKQGHKVRIRANKPQVVMEGDRIVALAEARPADVIVIQRPCRELWGQFIKAAQRAGSKVVVDFDDDLTDIHRLNTSYSAYQTHEMNANYCLESADMADWVVCATPFLAEKFGVGHNSVVPNHIPEAFLKIEGMNRNPDFVTVGWAGMTGTHPTDLQITHGAINDALTSARKKGVPARFLALGDARTLYNLNIRDRYPNDVREGVDIGKYTLMVSELDVGIVPLEDSDFNRAKSWLKGLEYSSLGIAPVVSPTPDNMRLVDAGAAWSAANPKEWREAVLTLLQDADEREKLQKQAKAFAAEWTIEGNAHKWLEAWTGQK